MFFVVLFGLVNAACCCSGLQASAAFLWISKRVTDDRDTVLYEYTNSIAYSATVGQGVSLQSYSELRIFPLKMIWGVKVG